MIKVTITGDCNSGKTTLALLIEKVLQDAGFDVANTDVDVVDGLAGANKSQDQRLQALASRGEPIVIQTVQVPRGSC
jgi:adenylylsulfate kinase-like enzyme